MNDPVNNGHIFRGYNIPRIDLYMMFGLVILCLSARYSFIPFCRVIAADGVSYIGTAKAMLKGDFSPIIGHGIGFPGLIAIAHLFIKDYELAGRLVASTLGSLAIVPVYLLGIRMFSRPAAVIACLLMISSGAMRNWQCEPMSQGPYLFYFMTGIYLTWTAFERVSRSRAFWGGLFLCLTFLTRNEALVAFAAMTAALLVCSRISGRPFSESVPLTVSFFAGFILLYLPFIMYVHHLTGSFSLAGKSANTLADSLGNYLKHPDIKSEFWFKKKGLSYLDIIKDYPGFFAWNIPRNLKVLFELMLSPLFWVLSLTGFAAGGWNRGEVAKKLFLLSTYAPLAIIITFFFVAPEYYQFYLPVTFLWLGQGACAIENSVSRIIPSLASLPKRTDGFVTLSVLLLLCYAIYDVYGQVPKDRNKPYHYEQDNGRYDHKLIGLRLKKVLPQDARIMTRWGRISFYAEFTNPQEMPKGDIADLLRYIREKKVEYIIIDGALMPFRHELDPFYYPLVEGSPYVEMFVSGSGAYEPVPGIKLHYVYKNPASLGVAVYRVVPML